MPPPLKIRPLDPDRGEVALVAARMRATLEEVLGEERGRALYTLEWLEERVRWHLAGGSLGAACVLLACQGEAVVGHTIVRLEPAEPGPLGLFSTTYVVPAARRGGVARALVRAGTRWLQAAGARALATDTAAGNAGLIRLFEGEGFRIRTRAEDMVRLERDLAAASEDLGGDL